MPTDKDYPKLESEFQSIKMAPAPDPGTQMGSQHNPGVCPYLNTPPTEGHVKTVWYYTPNGPAPSIDGKSPTERIETEFQQIEDQAIGPYDWNPQDSGRGGGGKVVESTMSNPLGQSWGAPAPKPMPPTPPGPPNNYGGGQSAGIGTPPGDSMNYGGGQGPGGGATPSGSPMGYGGGQGPQQ